MHISHFKAISSWAGSVQAPPSDHGDGHDSGSGSGRSSGSGSNYFRTLVGSDYDPERQTFFGSMTMAINIPTYNWRKHFRNGFVVISLLACGGFLNSVYNEQKYNLLARNWEEKWAQEKAAEQRKLDAISWKPLTPANKCLQYNTREYTSTLTNVPLSFDAHEICAQKTADLHREQVAPTYCGGEGQCGAVVGHWIASKDEPICQTVWAGPWDKGCQSPGIRHYHTYLENMFSSENWHEMCMTTPGIDLHGVYHPSPNTCDTTWNGKHRGIWFVDDSSCK
ncbi:hypothetical protein BJ165DRAFT_1183589 [Panaeolus papilionaceus]|nr:hypothetical protein BJ165DRAFT_1183589 [Panaeolus papilionaceus]